MSEWEFFVVLIDQNYIYMLDIVHSINILMPSCYNLDYKISIIASTVTCSYYIITAYYPHGTQYASPLKIA